MKNFRGHIALTVVCVILGFVVALQFRSVTRNNATSGELKRAETLQQQLNKEKELTASLSQQLLTYRSDLEQFRQQAATSGTYAEVLAKQLDEAEILAGLSELEGPGIVVTMKDSQIQTGSDSSVDDELYLIHDEDILRVINELRAAGAEALSINDERILATTEIRCAGPTVSVNNSRYAAPFIIRAIGDSKNLESALLLRGEWWII
jgi:uncharacterized protein YlxW (UPF0749 family)